MDVVLRYHELLEAIEVRNKQKVVDLLAEQEGLAHFILAYDELRVFRLAFHKRAYDIVEVLWNHLQKFNHYEDYGDIAGHVLALACYWGDMDTVKRVWLSNVRLSSQHRDLMLQWTFEAGRTGVLEYLVKNCALAGRKIELQPVQWRDFMELAYSNGHHATIKYALENIAQCSLTDEGNIYFCYAYFFMGNQEMWQLFFTRLPATIRSQHRFLNKKLFNLPLKEAIHSLKANTSKISITHLYIQACSHKRLDIVSQIMDDGELRQRCNFNYAENRAFASACSHGHLEVVEFLLFNQQVPMYIYCLNPYMFNAIVHSNVKEARLIRFFNKVTKHPRTREIFTHFSYFSDKEALLDKVLAAKKAKLALHMLKASEAPLRRFALKKHLQYLPDEIESLTKLLELMGQDNLTIDDFHKNYDETSMREGEDYNNYFLYACYNNNMALAKTLLEHPKTKHLFESQINFALDKACAFDGVELFRYLLKYALEHHIGLDLKPVYQFICQRNALSCLKVLFHFFPDLDTSFDNHVGFTSACIKGHLNMIDYMLTSPVNARAIDFQALDDDWFKFTAMNKRYEVVQYLLLKHGIALTPAILDVAQSDENVAQIVRQRQARDFKHLLDSSLERKDHRCKATKI